MDNSFKHNLQIVIASAISSIEDFIESNGYDPQNSVITVIVSPSVEVTTDYIEHVDEICIISNRFEADIVANDLESAMSGLTDQGFDFIVDEPSCPSSKHDLESEDPIEEIFINHKNKKE
jgi:hypothetical protein